MCGRGLLLAEKTWFTPSGSFGTMSAALFGITALAVFLTILLIVTMDLGCV